MNNIKGLVIALISIIVTMVGFTFKTLINSNMNNKVSIHDNKNNISTNKASIKHLSDDVDRGCK